MTKFKVNPITKKPIIIPTKGQMAKKAIMAVPNFLAFVGKNIAKDVTNAAHHLFYGKTGRGLDPGELKTHKKIFRKIKKDASKEHHVGNGLNSDTLQNYLFDKHPNIANKIYKTNRKLTKPQARQLLYTLNVDGHSRILDILAEK